MHTQRLYCSAVAVAVATAAVTLPGTSQCDDDGRSGSREDELVDVKSVVPTVKLDMRYATENNFTGTKLYPVARCRLRRRVAEVLRDVQGDAQAQGLSLKLWDCYRPISVQEKLWSMVPDERYVAKPVRGKEGSSSSKSTAWLQGSKHNRGAAVDVTLVDATTGAELPMPTGFDDFSSAAHRSYSGASDDQRANALLLEQLMVQHGFEPLPTEWWHFDGPGWRHFPLADTPL